jgi:hypothetical protein
MTDEPQTTAIVVIRSATMTHDNVQRLMKHLDHVISKALKPYLFEIPVVPDYLTITRDISQERTP